ncbi:formin-J-like isoform X2 [Bacillus rossius redtenbacheri]|uniref:formin-J-like isoform X2 n=1 Tax=Bacillus rossius redtenbacheri TaxID=93214 RepID=UPI002FDCD04B
MSASRYWMLSVVITFVENLLGEWLGLWLPLAAGFRVAFVVTKLSDIMDEDGEETPLPPPPPPPLEMLGGGDGQPPTPLPAVSPGGPWVSRVPPRGHASEPDLRRHRHRLQGLAAAEGSATSYESSSPRGGAGRYNLRPLVCHSRLACCVCK